jgi:hypothetical protein
MQGLGIHERPEYEGLEYEEHGTQYCEVTIYITPSETYPDPAKAFSMTTIGSRFTDTYQAIAREALRHLCQLYEDPIANTPMKFFPPCDKTSPTWIARMEALQAPDADPTMKYMATYLLALTDHLDDRTNEMKKCISRAEGAERYARGVYLKYVEAESHAADARSREAAIADSLTTTKDLQAQQLKEAYLAVRPKRMFAMLGQEPVIMEGHPAHPPRRRTNPAPPPEDHEAGTLFPATQPRGRVDPHSDDETVEGPRQHRSAAALIDEVD